MNYARGMNVIHAADSGTGIASCNFVCLYCGRHKLLDQSTLEHVIPRALGGANAPDRFKIRNVCKKCNNDLGSYVDASFAKSWFVVNDISKASRKLYDGTNEVPLPLTCMGPIDVPGILLSDGCLAEYWLGPSGETLVWLRQEDEDLYWYAGGNPRHRSTASRVYWFPASDNGIRNYIGYQSLFGAFKKKKNIRIVIGVACEGFPGNGYPPGFESPDETDVNNIAAIRSGLPGFHGRVSLNLRFDHRFIAKLALGVGYSLFGDSFLSTGHAEEFRKGCWPKMHDEIDLRGHPTFGGPGTIMGGVASYPGAVVMTVIQTRDGYALAMTIDEGRPFVVSLAPPDLECAVMDSFGTYALLLFPSIRHHLEMTLVQLIAHRNRSIRHSGLAAIDERMVRAERFWSALPPLPTRSV